MLECPRESRHDENLWPKRDVSQESVVVNVPRDVSRIEGMKQNFASQR